MPPLAQSAAKKAEVALCFLQQPTQSTREVADSVGLSHVTVSKILKERMHRSFCNCLRVGLVALSRPRGRSTNPDDHPPNVGKFRANLCAYSIWLEVVCVSATTPLALEDVAKLLQIVQSEDVSFEEIEQLFLTTRTLISHVMANVQLYIEACASATQSSGTISLLAICEFLV